MSILPASWVLTSIGDVALDIIQRAPEPSEKFTYIDISSIDRETKRITSPQALMGKGAPSRARKEVKAGDVLVSMTRPNLNAVAQVPEELDGQIASTGFDVLRPAITDPRWLYYIVRSGAFIKQMTSLVQGALYPAVRSKDIRGYKIPLAPLNEQKRIADKLDTLLVRLNACRERLDKVPQTLKRFRLAVLAAATSGALTEDWRETEGIEYDWLEVELGDIAEDFSYGSAAKSAKDGKTPVLRMGNIQNGQLDWKNLVFTSDSNEVEKYRLRAGDVLFNRTNSPELVGKTAVFKGEREAIYAGYLIRVRCGNKLIPDFLNYCLNSPAGRDYCWQVKSDGVSQSNINAKKLSAFPINLPPHNEQCEIVRRVETLFSFADRLEARYTSGREQVDQLIPSLLDKAFCGELVPQDPNDEPASELLQRIQEQKTNEPEKKRKPRANTIKNERHMNTKAITTLNELVSVLDLLGGDAMADRLVIESGLSDDIDRFFELLREGRNTLLDVPVGSNKPIRRIVDANQ